MKLMFAGLAGWARLEEGRSEQVKVIDTAITVLGTMLVAVTWVMLRG